MNPTISVIMSVKNDINNYLEESIKSILNQSFTNFEFLIVLDGSDDYTVKKINRFREIDKRIKTINQPNRGLTRSLNTAINLSTAELIVRQDFDDISKKNRLKHLVEYMNINNNVVIAGSNCNKINTFGKNIGRINVENNLSKLKNQFTFFNPIIHPTVIFRKNILKEYGFYNERYKVSQDYELWSKVSSKYMVGNVNHYLVDLRIHNSSISSQNNYLQRKYSFMIMLKNKFNELEKKIDNNLSLDILELFNLLEGEHINIKEFAISRMYVLFYDKVKTFSIFSYNIKILSLIMHYYYNRPKYLILRLLQIMK